MTGRTSQRKGRRAAPRCAVPGCKRRPVALGFCNTHLLRRADAVFSQYIRHRDGRCMKCGSGERLQCAHIISRRYRGPRWDTGNAVCLCARCHTYYEHRPLEWQDEWSDWDIRRREALDWSGDWRELAVACIERLDKSGGAG